MSPTKPKRAFRTVTIGGHPVGALFQRHCGEDVVNVVVEIVQPTESRAVGTFFIDGIHGVAEFGAHEVTEVGTSIALSVAMDCTSSLRTDCGPTVVQRRSARKKRKSNGIIPPDD